MKLKEQSINRLKVIRLFIFLLFFFFFHRDYNEFTFF